MGKFAVIDTETNWADQVMSIGTVIADSDAFQPIEMKYHILPKECRAGGMYYDALFLDTPVKPILCTRAEAIRDLKHGLPSTASRASSPTTPASTATTCRSCGATTGTTSCAWPPTASTTPKFPPTPTAAPPAA